MKYSDYMNVIANSDIDDWKYQGHMKHYVYMPNIAITMEDMENDLEQEVEEEWIEVFFESKTYRKSTHMFYHDGLVEDFRTLYIKDKKMCIPYPKVKDMSITPLQYGIGKIINMPYCNKEEYDMYLRKAGICIVG